MKNKANGEAQLRFAALRRVSTEQQKDTGESLRTQTSDITETAKELGGEIVQWYGGAESATPGHEKKEVGRLVEDAAKGKFNAVIVAHPDRWSRDNTFSQSGLQRFKENGVRFFAGGTEYDLFNPDHEMFLGVSAVIGQFFARNQMKKSMMNRIARAKRGIPTGGKLPYGRDWIASEDGQTGHWQNDEGKQAIIVDCAKRYLAGESLEKLSKEYRMNASNLWKVLTKVSGTDWELEFASKVLNIHETVTMTIPPLLDDKTIAAIHERTEANRKYEHGRPKHQYLLNGMIACDHCGYTLVPQPNRQGHLYYRHPPAYDRDRPCPGPHPKQYVKAEVIEAKVIELLHGMLGNPAALQRAIEAATPNRAKVLEQRKRLERITTELEDNSASVQRTMEREDKGLITKGDSDAKLGKLKQRREELEEEQARITDELANVPDAQATKQFVEKLTKSGKRYTSARHAAKLSLAQEFERMTFEDKKRLCKIVFSGTAADGKRNGVRITWLDNGTRWRFGLKGVLEHLYDPELAVGQFAWPPARK